MGRHVGYQYDTLVGMYLDVDLGTGKPLETLSETVSLEIEYRIKVQPELNKWGIMN